MDGVSNRKGVGLGIVLTDPEGEIIEQAIRLMFPASNNEAEYEVVVAGLGVARVMGVKDLLVYSDFKLIVNQLNKEYEAKDERIIAYMHKVWELASDFKSIEFRHFARDQNRHADGLAALATVLETDTPRTINIEVLQEPSIGTEGVISDIQTSSPSWMNEIIAYLQRDKLPEDRNQGHRV